MIRVPRGSPRPSRSLITSGHFLPSLLVRTIVLKSGPVGRHWVVRARSTGWCTTVGLNPIGIPSLRRESQVELGKYRRGVQGHREQRVRADIDPRFRGAGNHFERHEAQRLVVRRTHRLSRRIGMKQVEDYNESDRRVGYTMANISHGQRVSAAQRFLRPRRSNELDDLDGNACHPRPLRG